MEYRFNAQEWTKLPSEERVRRCRLLADEARKMTVGVNAAFRQHYLDLAAAWEGLANDIAAAQEWASSRT